MPDGRRHSRRTAAPRGRRLPAVALALAFSLLTALAATAPAQAASRVPQGFAGVVVDGPVFSDRVDLPRELDRMVGAGVERLRVEFDWSAIQPYRTRLQVPVDEQDDFRDEDGIPTRWGPTDHLVALAALRGLRILPVVNVAPPWARRNPDRRASPPNGTRTYARFAAALVRRYGTGGEFWDAAPEVPRVPITRWQIWNEPNLKAAWSDRGWAEDYPDLLAAAAAAIRATDRRARVVAAGLTNHSWTALAALYRDRRFRGAFDIAAVHPYTTKPRGVITILDRIRRVMRRHGDARVPVTVTETGWPSSKGRVTQEFGLETNERGQARRTAQLLPLLGRHRRRLRLEGFTIYTWMGLEEVHDFSFAYSGLRRMGPDGTVRSKPALTAFRRGALRLERCRRKGTTATRCAQRLRSTRRS